MTAAGTTRNVDANRNTNVNQNTTVNRNTNINVDQDVHRSSDNADIENVAVGEEHAYVKTEEGGVWVGEGEVHVHEDHDALRVAAGVAGVMAIGAMIATPPPALPRGRGPDELLLRRWRLLLASLWRRRGRFIGRGTAGGAVVRSCRRCCVDHPVGPVTYKNCGGYYYQPQGSNWVVVQL